ncbi:hypothetical protein [Methyloferula stellata]|nr:hypothetical protein [Methyloferula stellata]
MTMAPHLDGAGRDFGRSMVAFSLRFGKAGDFSGLAAQELKKI